MAKKVEYDFLNCTSFPSSLKITNDDPENGFIGFESPALPVTPGAFRIEVKVKQLNVMPAASPHVGNSAIFLRWYDGVKWRGWDIAFEKREVPGGTYDWREFKLYQDRISSDMKSIQATCIGGGGTPKGITWFDDLKIFQDDKLIYSNNFSNWAPLIIPAEIITGMAMIKFIK